MILVGFHLGPWVNISTLIAIGFILSVLFIQLEKHCSKKITTLHEAIEENEGLDVLYHLWSYNDINEKDVDGNSPLNLAVMMDNYKMASFCIKFGANVDSTDEENNSPLHHAAENGNKKMIMLLLKHGANVNSQNNNKETPLHIATHEQHEEAADKLLKSPFLTSLDIQDVYGNTPLHNAVFQRLYNTSCHIIDKGAQMNKQNNSLDTPLHLASKWNNVEIVKKLVSSGASLSLKNMQEDTAFIIATYRGHLRTAKFLMDFSENQRNHVGQNWLEQNLMKKKLNCMKMLQLFAHSKH